MFSRLAHTKSLHYHMFSVAPESLLQLFILPILRSYRSLFLFIGLQDYHQSRFRIHILSAIVINAPRSPDVRQGEENYEQMK
jgi:hypothetical protein